MSGGGGDTGGDDAGGSGKGSGGSGAGWGYDGSGNSGGGYSDPTAGMGAGGGYSDPLAGMGGGGGGGSDILSGGGGGGGSDILSGGGGGGSDLSGLISGGGGNDGLNLAGSGPVGGVNQPMAAGGTFSSSDATPGGSPGGLSLVQDTNSLGTTAPSSGGGSSAAAFAAPEGVSGTPQLSDWINNPTGTTTPAPTDAGIFDSLDAAQHGAANQYADTASLGVPANQAGSTLPAVSSGSSGGGSSTGGSSPSNGILGTGVTTNGLGIAAAGAGLLNNLINGPKSVPAVGPLNATASNASAVSNDLLARGTQQGQQFGTPALQSGQDQVAKGQALQQYVATGQLPPGYEDQVQQAAQAAKQTIISNYANRGLPTDPTMNSSLAQELAQVDARLPAAREQLAQQLATTGNSIVASGNSTSQTGNQVTGNQLLTDGLSAAGISSSVYTTLANLQNDQNKQNGAAIANFAAALNGGNKGLTVNLGKAA